MLETVRKLEVLFHIFPDDFYDTPINFYMKGDIYSYGLVLVFMMTGEKPWSQAASCAVLDAKQEMPEVTFPEKLKGPLKEICEKCCNTDPGIRPSAEEIVTKHFQGGFQCLNS